MNKRTLTKLVDPYLFSKGFTFNPFGDGSYMQENELGTFKISLFLNFKKRDFLASTYLIHLNEIETILDIIRPEKQYFSPITMQDRINHNVYGDRTRALDLTSEKGFKQWAELINEYVENEGAAYIKKYTYLPNIFNEMNKLDEQGKNYREFFHGQADINFRALIVSKLCNDPHFDKKIEKLDNGYLNSNYPFWEDLYIKLKAVLEDVEPKYNI